MSGLRRKSKNQNIGNLIIGLSSLFFVILLFPLIKAYLFPTQYNVPKNSAGIPTGSVIVIPKLDIEAPIIEDVDPFNATEYRLALKKGVAQAKGTSFPGEGKKAFLFAHSSDYPWRAGNYNTVFFRLKDLKLGDEIIIYKDLTPLNYRVNETKIVWPSDVSYLTEEHDQNVLIIQTCWPVGTSFRRLLVFATPN